MSDITYFLAGAQPSWYRRISETELRALLNLAGLFSETVYMSDTQLADNPHLFRSFRTVGSNPAGLYGALRLLIEYGIVRPLVRDAFYIAAEDRQIQCASMMDVYRGWLEQDMPGAWVVADTSRNRDAFVKDLDRIVTSDRMLRYDYLDVKQHFMLRLRKHLEPRSDRLLGRLVARLPEELQAEYREIVGRFFFSHSDLYDWASRVNLSPDHPIRYIQGLLDESSYADAFQSGMFGADTAAFDSEQSVWDMGSDLPPHELRLRLSEDFLEQAERVWTSPSLRLIGLLTPEEVMDLRKIGRPLFQIRELNSDIADKDVTVLRRQYEDLLEDYWFRICEMIVEKHPEVSTAPTRIGLFLRQSIRWLPKRLRDVASLTVSIPIRLLPIHGSQESLHDLRSKLSLRLLVFSETQEMRQLRAALPGKSWLANPWPLLESEATPLLDSDRTRRLPSPAGEDKAIQRKRNSLKWVPYAI